MRPLVTLPVVAHERPRLPGLDLLRCIAVIAVILHHYPHSPSQMILRALGHYGWAGVDLFFVLSGYLIAGQFFAAMIRGKPISIRNFYYRRAIRILPNYFAVLAVYVILAAAHGTHVARLWTYLTFTQNFGIPLVFNTSWSLCVEQHFYLLFPFVVWVAAGSKGPTVGIVCLCVTLGAGIALRYALWLRLRPDLIPDPNQGFAVFFRNIYYPSYTRLDGIACGVALAALQNFCPRAWQRAMGFGNWLLVPAAGLLLLTAVLSKHELSSFHCVLSFTTFGMAFGFLVAAAVVPNGFLSRVRFSGIETLALWSYAIYLTHVFALDAAHEVCEHFHFGEHGLPMALSIAIFIPLMSAPLFYGVERVFLRIRDRRSRAIQSAPSSLRV